MSLEALAVALRADLAAELSLALIHLADASDEYHVSIPHLPLLAAKVGVDDDRLRNILDELVSDGLLSPVSDHPFDFISRTEGFRLNLEEVPVITHIESPWSKGLRVVSS